MSDIAYWNDLWNRYPDLAVNNFAKKAYKVIQEKDLKTLLDVGCGTGQDSLYFASQELEVTAIDLSTCGIQSLQSKNPKIKCIAGDICYMQFPPESFDVVYAHLSLHYFDDAVTSRIFNNIYSILRKGGLLFVKCKSTEDRLFGQGEKAGENMYFNKHTRHFFTREYMAEKLLKFNTIHLRQTASAYGRFKSAFIEAIAQK
jgi:SAM-dependent methyltransferase